MERLKMIVTKLLKECYGYCNFCGVKVDKFFRVIEASIARSMLHFEKFYKLLKNF